MKIIETFMDKQYTEKCQFMWMLEILLICAAVLTFIPIMITSAYTFYSADDFSVISDAGRYGTNTIICALKYAVQCYFTWQGTYTSSFLMVFLSPLNGGGYVWLRAVMISNVLLFGGSLWVFVKGVCRSLNMDKINYQILFYSLCIIGVLAFQGWTEIFYWFTGAMVYSFPMSFCLLGAGIALQSNNIKGICVSALLMFFSAGGSLEIAGIGCFVLLGVCFVKWTLKKVEIKDYIIFGFAFLGALINTVAPGNYVRHAAIDDTGLHIGRALIFTVLEVARNVEELLFDTPCIFLVFVAGIIGASVGKRAHYKKIRGGGTIVVLCIMAPFITYFPVFLGYSKLGVPNRCKFVETIVIILALMIIGAISGHAVNEKINLLRIGKLCIGVVVLLIIISSLNPSWRLSQLVPAQMWERIADGSYKNYYEEIKEIYDLVENDTNENVFIYNIPEEISLFPVLRLQDDMSYWVNIGVADYFQKESVQRVTNPLAIQADGQKNIRISPMIFDNKDGYISICRLDEEGQIVEMLYELQLLDSNILISKSSEETGKLEICLYEDSEGTVLIDKKEIEY